MPSEERAIKMGQLPSNVDNSSAELNAGVIPMPSAATANQAKKYIPYTIKLPSEQLSALQSIWLELKRLYGVNSPDKSGMIQQAVADWLKQWDGPEKTRLLSELLEIREDTRRRQYRKD
jgi:hypothetical protein